MGADLEASGAKACGVSSKETVGRWGFLDLDKADWPILFLYSFPLKPCFPRGCDHMYRFKRYNPIPSSQHCFQ